MTKEQEYFYRMGQSKGFAQAAGAVQCEIEELQVNPTALPTLQALAYEFRQMAKSRFPKPFTRKSQNN